jgi:hypothetical protein
MPSIFIGVSSIFICHCSRDYPTAFIQQGLIIARSLPAFANAFVADLMSKAEPFNRAVNLLRSIKEAWHP